MRADRNAILQRLRQARERSEIEHAETLLRPLSVFETSAAIYAWSRINEWQRALSYLSELRSRRLQPDAITHSSALAACEKGGQWEDALELLRDLGRQLHKLDVVSHSTTMSCCARAD